MPLSLSRVMKSIVGPAFVFTSLFNPNLVHFADPSGVIENPFGKSRFPAVDVSGDSDVSDFRVRSYLRFCGGNGGLILGLFYHCSAEFRCVP